MTEPATLVWALRKSEVNLDEVDRILERRAKGKTLKELANERTAIWKESEATYKAENKEARRHMWIAHYRRLARAHIGNAARLERKATALLKNGEA